MKEIGDCAAILSVLHFASTKHRDQRRKGEEASPYINHPIEVTELLARIGRVKDIVTLQSAALHDTIEDTHTTPEELESLFGPEVRHVVQEVTDNKDLPKEHRKQLQIDSAPHLSERAKIIRLADKISNVRAIAQSPPTGWSLERQRSYLDWTEKVVDGLRGSNEQLEEFYESSLRMARETLDKRYP